VVGWRANPEPLRLPPLPSSPLLLLDARSLGEALAFELGVHGLSAKQRQALSVNACTTPNLNANGRFR